MKNKLFLLLSLLPSTFAFANVKSIIITGLSRTEESVVLRELPYKIGDNIDESQSEQAKQKLYNLRLFSEVKHEIVNSNDGQYVKIDVTERWTTIPILKFSNGGGITQFTLGAYDINLFGKYIEGGAQIQKRGSSTAGVVWLREPRLFGSNLKFSLDLWSVMNVYKIYDRSGTSTELEHAYLEDQKRISSELEYKFTEKFSVSFNFSRHQNEYSDRSLTEEENKVTNNFPLPDAEIHNKFGLGLRLGVINYGPWNQSGQTLEINVKQTNYAFESGHIDNHKSNEFFANYKGFLDLPFSSSFAVNFSHEKKSKPTESDKIFVGGLDKVRGFLDNRFKGNNVNLANFEYRIPSYESSSIVLQHIVFFDYGSIIDESDDFETRRNEIYSVGTGLRFISPKIYRLVGRLDFAKSLKGDGKLPISFGVQQFF